MIAHIVTVLKLIPKTGIPKAALRDEVGIRFGMVVGEQDFGLAIVRLRDTGFITLSEDELTGDERITPTQKVFTR